MSMDEIFHSDEQVFVTKPTQFRDFMEDASWARRYCEEALQFSKFSEGNIIKRFSKLTNLPIEAAQHILDDLESFHTEYEKDRTYEELNAPIESFPNNNFRTLKILKAERVKRLNRQYKSAALRMLKYDMADMSPFTTNKLAIIQAEVENNETEYQDHCAVLHGRTLLNHNQDSNNVWDNIRSTTFSEELCEQNAKVKWKPSHTNFHVTSDYYMPDEEMRSDNLFWGKDDLIVSVSLFVGYARELQRHEIRMGRLLKVAQKFFLSGQNTLSDLRKCLLCPQDHMFSEDMSEKQLREDDTNKYHFPSSYFFIHDTFYIDDETPNAVDLTEPIRQWASRKDKIGPMKTATMRETKIVDLVARLGQPYLFLHQGTCEHLLCFNDIWLRSHSDAPGPFPFKLVQKSFKSLICAACKKNSADWRVVGSNYLPQSPMFFCNDCYTQFFFDETGKKFGQFKAVPHLDRKVMEGTELFLKNITNQSAIC